MSKVEVNQISSQCGSTLTIGQSGDTVTLASGASQTGFGRTGTVDWDTTAKTASFTAVSGNGYFVNTTSGAITLTLPASPSAGDIVSFKDYANTFDTNNLTINRNGSPIAGQSADAIISVEGQSGTLVYVDGTKGWMIVNASTDSDLPAPLFVTATGGTVTTSGDYKIHTFTGPGTFTVSCAGNSSGSTQMDYLVIAGGGGGGGGYQSGGGGAGGYRESSGTASGCYTVSSRGSCVSALTAAVQGYPITVGGGGPGGPSTPSSANFGQVGTAGSNSIFSTITSAGGGRGGSFRDGGCGPNEVGGPGGSGGGAGRSPATNSGGTGNTPPVSPPQGTNGGSTQPPYVAPYSGGAGGGAISPGGPGQASCFAIGGSGATSAINATPTTRAGGGGAGNGTTTPGAANGGPGGGGNGGWGNTASGGTNADPGTANTGGGGGGAGYECQPGGAGGSGIVIIRYKFQ